MLYKDCIFDIFIIFLILFYILLSLHLFSVAYFNRFNGRIYSSVTLLQNLT